VVLVMEADNRTLVSQISPFFADMSKMKLPSALFVIGTLDCLLDDSVLMSAKWRMSGAESLLKVYPGEHYDHICWQEFS
jgi:acetyl esterase/lipase